MARTNSDLYVEASHCNSTLQSPVYGRLTPARAHFCTSKWIIDLKILLWFQNWQTEQWTRLIKSWWAGRTRCGAWNSVKFCAPDHRCIPFNLDHWCHWWKWQNGSKSGFDIVTSYIVGQFWYFFVASNKNLTLKMRMPLNIQSYTREGSLSPRHSTSVPLYSSCFYSSRLLPHLDFLIFHRLSLPHICHFARPPTFYVPFPISPMCP